MTKPLTDIRRDLIAITRSVILENFDVEGHIAESIGVIVVGKDYSAAFVHLNGLFLGTFDVEELYVNASSMIVSAISQKIDSEDCNDLQGLFAISVLG